MEPAPAPPRPLGVTLMGGALALLGACGLLFCLAALVDLFRSLDASSGWMTPGFDGFEAFALLALGGMGALSALGLAAGVGALRGQASARTAILMGVPLAVLGLAMLGLLDVDGVHPGRSLLSAAFLAFAVALLVYFTRPRVRAWFERS